MKKWFVIGIGMVIIIALVCGMIGIIHAYNNENEVAETYIPTDEELMVWFEGWANLDSCENITVDIKPNTDEDYIHCLVYVDGRLAFGSTADRDYVTEMYYQHN